jgi:hypothetical protein
LNVLVGYPQSRRTPVDNCPYCLTVTLTPRRYPKNVSPSVHEARPLRCALEALNARLLEICSEGEDVVKEVWV